MSWREVSVMDQRREFVRLAMQEGANRRELCRRFGISPQIGYKWIGRWLEGDSELSDRSHRPHHSPGRSDSRIEQRVLEMREVHPAWGARKIARCLDRRGVTVPAVSTVHAILKRYDRVGGPNGAAQRSYQRFEREAPNLLWQMDFKGWIALRDEARCHPLTIPDDHSRFALCLAACANEQGTTVQRELTATFRHYGLPDAVFVDNGSPWGDASGARWTALGVWLLKLGVDVVHSRPFHPQSRGKNERFHRTLKAEVLAFEHFRNPGEAQRAFDRWRLIYNFERPHEALDLDVPANRYRPSARAMPDHLPVAEYDEHDIVRTVSTTKSYISFKGRPWNVPQAFRGERVAIRPRGADGCYGIFFGAREIATIDLRRPDVDGRSRP
jgi:transposase InsO family protein